MREIEFVIGPVTITAECLDTPTAEAVLAAAPFTAEARTWGDEVYFDAPVAAEPEADAREVVEPGEIAFWAQGGCIAIGFGPTPASRGEEIRLADAVNVWAVTRDDVRALKRVKAGAPVEVRARD